MGLTDRGPLFRYAPTFLALFVGGVLVFFVGGYWAAIPAGARSLIKLVLPVVLLVLMLLCNRVERWGSVLFHAGADLMIMVGILQTHKAA